MNNFKPLNILAIDDNELNLEVLKINIEELGHTPITASEGIAAWNIIQSNKENINVIIIDRMMPNMSGLELTQKLQADPVLRNIPVIIQSGKTSDADLSDALNVGALFYLKKPYMPDDISSMINSIYQNINHERSLNELANDEADLGKREYEVQNIDDMYHVICEISKNTSKQHIIKRVLTELILNSIEHGNLELGLETKEQLLTNQIWKKTIDEKLKSPENIDKRVTIKTNRTHDSLEVEIKDQGNGFNWQEYKEIKPENIIKINGRGIATAFKMLPTLEYIGNGSEVHCKFNI